MKTIAAIDAFEFSEAQVTQAANWLGVGVLRRFVGSAVWGQGRHVPAGRASFKTASRVVKVKLATGAPSGTTGAEIISLLVDGVEATSQPAITNSIVTLTVDNGSTAMRIYDVICPYATPTWFTSVVIDDGQTVVRAPMRVLDTLVVVGDSITQGFSTSRSTKTWPFLLAKAKNWRLVNLGYFGLPTTPELGFYAGSEASPGAGLLRTVFMFGTNDAAWKLTPADTMQRTKQMLQNYRTLQFVAPVTVVTPLWRSTDAEPQRQAIRDAVASLADPNTTLVEGLTLASNSLTHFPDGLHPNDLGSAEIAANLAQLVV